MENELKWAKEYFSRLESKATELMNNPLIEHVRLRMYEPVSDETIDKVEKLIGFQLDNHLKAFYKISNGLHFSWYSKAAMGSFKESFIQKGKKYHELVKPDPSGYGEGCIHLLPLEIILDSTIFPLDKGGVSSAPFDYESEAHVLTLWDYYNFYYDTGLCFHNGKTYVAYGDDHSAIYKLSEEMSVKPYLEHLLATWGSIYARTGILKESSYNEQLNYGEVKEIIANNDSTRIDQLFNQSKFNSIEYTIKEHFDNGYMNHDPEAFWKAKPDSLITEMERILDFEIRLNFLEG